GAGPAVQPKQRQRLHFSIHGAGALEDHLLLRWKVVFPAMGGIDFSAASVPGPRPAALARRAGGDFVSGASAVPARPPICRVLVPAADGRSDHADGSGLPLPNRGGSFPAPVASVEPDSVPSGTDRGPPAGEREPRVRLRARAVCPHGPKP